MASAICLLTLIPAKAQAITVSYNCSFSSTAVVEVSGGSLNIRNKPSTSGSVVGSFSNHAGATIKKKVSGDNGDWYYISSGSVKGYAKAGYFLRGSEAASAAKKYGKVYYAVDVDALRMRESASTTSDTVAVLSAKQKVTFINSTVTRKDGYAWVHVKATVNGKTYRGYVVKKYLKRYITLENAASINQSSSSTASASSSGNSTGSTSGTTTVTTTNVAGLGSKIVSSAKNYVGRLSYVYGGTSLSTGADCSGFVQSIYRIYGVSVPRTSSSQAANGKSISRSNLRLGDLVFYGSGTINHVAIYIGDGKIVHCANPTRDCVIDNMDYMTVRKCVTYIH